MSLNREDLRNYDYKQAEDFYRQGAIGQADWDWFRHVWRNGTVRFSTVAIEFEHRTETEKSTCPICVAEGLKTLRILLMPIQRGMEGWGTGLRWSVKVEHPDGSRTLVESYAKLTDAIGCLRSQSMRLHAPAYKLSAGEKKKTLLFDCGKTPEHNNTCNCSICTAGDSGSDFEDPAWGGEAHL
ncbi:MAG: hypothetical protein ACRD1X_14635 [Vicinamibacteria bacterium]